MVYEGPARGCRACQQRRVKVCNISLTNNSNSNNQSLQCDRQLPSCRNCVRRHEECSGYRDDFDVCLRDQTHLMPCKQITSNLRNAKKRQRSLVINNQKLRITTKELKNVSEITQSLHTDRETQALQFFFSNFVLIARDAQTSRGFLEVLLPLYVGARCDSALSLATSAVALELMSLWSEVPLNSHSVREIYGKAVSSTKVALKDPNESKSDQLLVAVLLLDLYETVRCRWTGQGLSQSHQDGALALIRHRGPTNFSNRISKHLLLAVRNRLVFQGPRKSGGIEVATELWKGELCSHKNLGTVLDSLSIRAASVHATMLEISSPVGLFPISDLSLSGASSAELNEIQAKQLLYEANGLEIELQQWFDSIPGYWHPVPILRKDVHPDVQSAGFYGSYCDVYAHVYACSIFNSYRWTLILVLHTILGFEKLLQSRCSQTQQSSPDVPIDLQIQALVDSTCASVPFLLGDRTKWASSVDFLDIKYPPSHPAFGVLEPFSLSDEVSGGVTTLTGNEHMRISSTMGVFFTLNVLLPILSLTRPAKNTECSQIRLRHRQREWILGQVSRVQGLFCRPSSLGAYCRV